MRRPPIFVPAWQPRRRPLYSLTDQGASVAVDLTAFGVGGRDRTWGPHAQNFLSANRPHLAALAITPELTAERDTIDLRLRPAGIVGAVPLRTPDTRKVVGGIVVQPRFGWDGVGPLLDRVGWSAQPEILALPLVPGSAREVPPWVLAGPALQRLGLLLHELRRGFHLQEEVRQTPRGQILWQRYITSEARRGAFHRLPCRFPELGHDLTLRGYLRWGVEAVQRSLNPVAGTDALARRLVHQAEELLDALQDTPSRLPDRRSLQMLVSGTGLPTAVLTRGIEALGWIVDERGLAGRAETDGLAWALPMHALFERWVEHLVRVWARGFGGDVRTGRNAETAVPLQWSRAGHGSLGSLVPDLVVRHGEQVYVVDAKYKGHLQDLDEARWLSAADELREEHRHDVHQVLAYAALYPGNQVTSVLIYPMHARTWERLAGSGRTVSTATLTAGGRFIRLALVGVPVQLPANHDVGTVVQRWGRLQEEVG